MSDQQDKHQTNEGCIDAVLDKERINVEIRCKAGLDSRRERKTEWCRATREGGRESWVGLIIVWVAVVGLATAIR